MASARASISDSLSAFREEVTVISSSRMVIFFRDSISSRISSLNASAAAAVLLYEALRQRLG